MVDTHIQSFFLKFCINGSRPLRPPVFQRCLLYTSKDGKRYITPEKTAKPDVYNPLKESSEMVLEALNVGMLMMNCLLYTSRCV